MYILFTLTKIYSFVVTARERYKKVSRMFENMEKLFRSITEYYVLDAKKVSVEEFFTDVNNFRTMFLVCTIGVFLVFYTS